MRTVAATPGKRDVVLAISTTDRPREIVDAATIAKEYGTTIVAITKPNSPLAMVCGHFARLVCARNPEYPETDRGALCSPRDTQERMRHIKYALVNLGDGDADGPLGD